MHCMNWIGTVIKKKKEFLLSPIKNIYVDKKNHQNKKNGAVTWTISSNSCFILFPEILKTQKNIQGIY